MKIDKVLAVFLIFGLVASFVVAYERYGIEKEFKSVQIMADYQDFYNMSRDSDMEIVEYLKKMKEGGISSAAISEETIQSMQISPLFHIGTRMEGMNLIIQGDTKDLEFIKRGLETTLKESRKIEWKGQDTLIIYGLPEDYIYTNSNIMDFRGNKEALAKTWEGLRLETLGLGFSEEKINQILDAGMVPLLRPVYSHEYQDAHKSIDRYFSYIRKLPQEYKQSANVILCAGDEFLGYDEPEYMYEKLKEHGMVLGLIESNVKGKNLKAKGQISLTKAAHYQAIKVFTTWDYIQKRYDYEIPRHHKGEEIANTFYRAIIDRNIRLIYLKPYLFPEGRYVTNPQAYIDTVSNLQNRLYKHNIVIGSQIVPMRNWEVNPVKKIPVLWAIVAGLLILLENLLPIRKKGLYVLLALGGIVATVPFALGIATDTLSPIWALLGTIVVASLSSAYVLGTGRKLFDRRKAGSTLQGLLIGIKTLIIAVFAGVAGALFEVTLLSNSKYLLDIITFKGVKFSQLMPILIVGLLYMAYFGVGKIKEAGEQRLRFDDTWRLLNKNIKIWQVLLLGLFGIVVIIFMARSGNTSDVKPGTLELLMRNFMEHHFIARPRTKSIFLGFPAVILFIYLAKQHKMEILYPVLAIAVAIGQSNIQNTFSHIRTPMYLSVGRVGGELVISVFVGTILVWIFSRILRMRKRKLKQERNADV